MKALIDRLSVTGFLVVSAVTLLLWWVVNKNSEPGTRVSVLYGLFEYTKPVPPSITQEPLLKLMDENPSSKLSEAAPSKSVLSDIENQAETSKKTPIPVHPAEKILVEVKQSRPYVRNTIEEAYMGMEVEWTGWVDDILFNEDNSANIILNVSKNDSFRVFWVKTDIKSQPSIKRFSVGEKLMVNGVISDFQVNTIFVAPSKITRLPEER